MKRIRTNNPPTTRNPEARALIERAQANCAGCRTNWRLKIGPRGNFTHRAPGGTVQCWAMEQRQALREIAARGRGK